MAFLKVTGNPPSRVDEENPYWVSFSDLMSALLVIFILAAVALIIELTQRNQTVTQGIEELKQAEKARKSILEEIQSELARSNIVVEIADNDTVIRVPEQTLTFASGDDDLPDDPRIHDNVVQIGRVLHAAILRDDRFKQLDTVFVEGHSDNVGIWYRGKGNWGLSGDRAITVWQRWLSDKELTPALGNIHNARGQRLFSVSGYAETRPAEADQSTAANRAKNRRIDIRFTVKRPAIADLQRIIQ